MTLEEYIGKIDGFLNKEASEQILYFGYYLVTYKGYTSFTGKDISLCFEELRLPPYSNVSSFLSRAKIKKLVVKDRKCGYLLARRESEEIALSIQDNAMKTPSDNLFPLELLRNTRSYLERTAKEASLCYDMQLFNACLVMVRRLLESLIIEIFELYKVQDRIKDKRGNYKFCGDLIDELLKEQGLWTIGRNASKALPAIKTIGDMCAHNRRFNACRADVDKNKDGLRVVLEELIHLGQYDRR
jgi:hypothetical protein